MAQVPQTADYGTDQTIQDQGPQPLWTADVTAYDDGTYGVEFESPEDEQAEEGGGEAAEGSGEEIKCGSLKELLATILQAAKNGGNAGAEQQEQEGFDSVGGK